MVNEYKEHLKRIGWREASIRPVGVDRRPTVAAPAYTTAVFVGILFQAFENGSGFLKDGGHNVAALAGMAKGSPGDSLHSIERNLYLTGLAIVRIDGFEEKELSSGFTRLGHSAKE